MYFLSDIVVVEWNVAFLNKRGVMLTSDIGERASQSRRTCKTGVWPRLLVIVLGLAVLFAGRGLAETPVSDIWLSPAFPDHPLKDPGAAVGAVIYLHGRTENKDSYDSNPPLYLKMFVKAGWDVFRLNRKFTADIEDASVLHRLQTEVEGLRGRGYKRVVLAGQSRGGWLAIAAASRGQVIDAIIATAPGVYGDSTHDRISRSAEAIHAALRSIRSPTRVALFFFDGDPREDVIGGRAEPSRRALRSAGVPHIVVDRPNGFDGHFGAWHPLFARRYGECLLGFAGGDTSPMRDSCDLTSGLAVGADIPLPADVRVRVPDRDAPPAYSAFAGHWYGENERDGAAEILIVSELRPDGAVANFGYSPPPHLLGAKPWARRMTLHHDDGALVEKTSKGKKTFRLVNADEVESIWWEAAQDRDYRVRMRRQVVPVTTSGKEMPANTVTLAQASVDERMLSAHVTALLTGMPTVSKWTVPIYYTLIGIDRPEAEQALIGNLRQIGALAGLSVNADDTADSSRTNLVLIFSDDPSVLADDPGIRQIFADPQNPSVDDFRRQLRNIRGGWLKHVVRYADRIAYYALIVDRSLLTGPDARWHALRLAYASLVDTGPSTVISPSLTNPRGTKADGMPKIDLAVLKALYSPDVRFGSPSGSALGDLTRRVRAALE